MYLLLRFDTPTLNIFFYINYFGFHLLNYFGFQFGFNNIKQLKLGSIDPFLLCAIVPIKSYSNAEADKVQIINDNQNKSGIYMWKNTINDKKYIGFT